MADLIVPTALAGLAVSAPVLPPLRVKTITGSASAAGEAIDSLKWPEVLGTIAGDNTVFIAIHDARAAQEVVRKFQSMMK